MLNPMKSEIAVLLLFLCTMALCHDAFAREKISRLTEENITEFITETTEITNNSADMAREEIVEYLQQHLHKKGYFRSSIKYNIPGFPSQENVLGLDKKQFIENVADSAETLDDYRSEVEIKEILISKDKKKATVTTISTESGEMPMSDEESGGSSVNVPIDGKSTCVQTLMLEDGNIQMFTANCSTEITFSSSF